MEEAKQKRQAEIVKDRHDEDVLDHGIAFSRAADMFSSYTWIHLQHLVTRVGSADVDTSASNPVEDRTSVTVTEVPDEVVEYMLKAQYTSAQQVASNAKHKL